MQHLQKLPAIIWELRIFGLNHRMEPGSTYRNGSMVKGWLQDGDKWYYLNQDGNMLANGWICCGIRWKKAALPLRLKP